jgi:hypothetical protein
MSNYQGLDSKLVGDALDQLIGFSDVFISGVLTGTGASQSIAHGFAAAPSKVLVTLYSSSGTAAIVEGVHDATSIKVNVTTGDTFKVIAFR